MCSLERLPLARANGSLQSLLAERGWFPSTHLEEQENP